MCFDIIDAARIHAGVVKGRCDHCRLSIDARCRKTGFGTTIVVDSDTTNHSKYLIAIGKCVRKSFQQHHGSAITEHRSLRLRVESTRVPIRGQHCSFLVKVSTTRRAGDRHAASQRHIALATAQTRHRLHYRDQ